MERSTNRLTVQWPPTMKFILTTNTSWSKSLIIDNLCQVMLRLRVAVVHFSHIVLCNMLRERIRIFKQRWLSQAIITLVISTKMDNNVEDQLMLMIEKERPIIKIKTKWKWALWASIINSLLHNKLKVEITQLHVTEKLSTKAKSNKKSIANNC